MPDWNQLRESMLGDKLKSVLPPSIVMPTLPKALMDFRSKAQDPDFDMKELSQIISSDAGLSTDLLRNVNSVSTGVQNKVTSVNQALVTLGIRATLMHLTTSGVQQVMKQSASKLINFQNFWNTNLERSLFASELADLLGADRDVAYTAGMLQDFILPIVTNQMFKEYLEFGENRDDYDNIVSFERKKMGWDHAEAAAQIMYAWKFPDELVCCVFLHHQGTKLLEEPELKNTSAAAVALSSWIPDALRQENDGLEKLIELESQWAEFNILEIAEKVDQKFQEVTNNAKNHFSFLRIYQNACSKRALS